MTARRNRTAITEFTSDIANAMLRVVAIYKRDKPQMTTDELSAILAECIDVVADQIPDLAERIVSSVTIKSKAKTRPKVRVGDVFAVTLEKKTFYGRVVHRSKLGALLEFYDLPSSCRFTFGDLKAACLSGFIFKYVFESPFFLDPHVRVIGHIRVPGDVSLPTFFTFGGSSSHPKNKRVPQLTKHHIAAMDPLKVYMAESLLANLSQHGVQHNWPDTVKARQEVLITRLR